MVSEIGSSEWPLLIRTLLIESLLPLLTMGGLLLVVTAGTHLAITKMGFSLQKLVPKFERYNPMSRLRELPGQNFKSVVEAILLLGISALAITSIYGRQMAALQRIPFQALPTAMLEIGDMLQGLLWKAAAVFVAFGAVDFFRQYRKHMAGLRMTKQEIKEEHKRNEGDPQIKGRVRRLRRELLRRQMMRDVPKATVVVVNPTHFAVAIRYDSESMASPVVVAKGRNWLALRIRQIALHHEVPIIENPPLARGLYDAVEVGQAITPEFYKAIAEILGYIYHVMGRKLPT